MSANSLLKPDSTALVVIDLQEKLVPAIDGKGRVAAVEIMFNSPAVAQLIRENLIKQIPNAIAAGGEEGMQSFNTSLVGMVKDKLVKKEDALNLSDNPEELEMNLKGIYLSSAKGGILKR